MIHCPSPVAPVSRSRCKPSNRVSGGCASEVSRRPNESEDFTIYQPVRAALRAAPAPSTPRAEDRQRASQTSTEKIGSPSRLLSTSMPNPAPVGTRPMPLLERGWWPATCSFDQSFMKDTVKRLSG